MLYQLCLLIVSHELAYGVSWIAGLTFLVVVYPSKVFSVSNSDWTQKVLIVLLYAVNFLVGLWFLNQLVTRQVAPEFAIFMVLAYTTVVNFLGMRLILRRKL